MEPLGTIAARIASDAADVLRNESEGFVKAALREPANSVGSLLALALNERLRRNLIQATVRANRQLAEAGLMPQPVPLTIIHPALQAASYEEDSDLQTVWASLLANAADPRQHNPVLPSFPTILKELTSREVKFLNALRMRSSAKGGRQEPHAYSRDMLQTLYVEAGLARCSFLGRLEHKVYSEQEWHDFLRDESEFSITFDVLKRHGIVYEVAYVSDGYGVGARVAYKYAISELGVAFVDACQPPTCSVVK
jgi:hypothetical protein